MSELKYEAVLWIGVSLFTLIVDSFVCSRFSPAIQPKSVVRATRIELGSGIFLMIITSGLMYMEPMPILWIIGICGLGWTILSWFLRRGYKRLRWVFIPLSILRLTIPLIGWGASFLSIYFLFFASESKTYFKENSEADDE